MRANVGAEDFDVEQCCAKCGKWDFGAGSDVSLKRCARCLTIYYCSPACQKEHWPQHKKHCKRLKAERDAAKGLTGAMAAARQVRRGARRTRRARIFAWRRRGSRM